jgi:hypothetical protein
VSAGDRLAVLPPALVVYAGLCLLQALFAPGQGLSNLIELAAPLDQDLLTHLPVTVPALAQPPIDGRQPLTLFLDAALGDDQSA